MILLATDRQTVRGLSVSHFLPAGILSYRCPLETARFWCDRKQISGAILDGVPDLPGAEALARDLRAAYPDLPMALVAPPGSLPDAPVDRTVRDADPARLGPDLLDFLRERVGWRETFSTFALTLPLDASAARLLGYPFPLPLREASILRCLFAFAPRVVPADDLLDLCFPEGNQRAANLSVLISRVNRRAAEIGLPDLVVSEYGRGYRLNRAIL